MRHHVVIIGGGFGGLNAAKQLKNAPVDITLIDRRNHHLFQPLLYQVATGELSAADIASPLRGLLKQQRNARVLLGEVTGFDPERREVILRDRTIRYDSLIVAAGSGTHYFGSEHWAQWAPSLKSIEDATDIRRRILCAFEEAERSTDPSSVRQWLTFVIVGGGPTGVELAGALAEIARESLKHDFRSINPADARIILLQSPERILPTYNPELSRQAQGALERRGVEVRTGVRVTDVDETGIMLRHGDTLERIDARTVLWAAGVKPSPLGQSLAQATGAQLDRSGRVIVQADLSLPGFPEIFVIGDLANFSHQTGEPLPGVAQVAIQGGRYAGTLIERRLRGQSLPPFHYSDHGNVATIGRNEAIAEIGRLRFSGRLAWALWVAIHLLYHGDMAKRALVLLQWLWNYLTRGRTALLITTPQPMPSPEPQRRTQTLTLPAATS